MPTQSAQPAASTRTRVVWSVLAAGLTGVTGLLYAISGGQTSQPLAGMSLTPLAAMNGPETVEGIYHTNIDVDPDRWSGIVIHHTNSPAGSPESETARSREMNLNGLGVHFLIGNGAGMGDGEIHIGYRWLEQAPGAHVAGPRGDAMNRSTIGISLVGSGDRRPFTENQLRRLVQLVDSLVTTLDIPADQVLLHRDLAETTSPGRFFPEALLRESIDYLQ